VSGERLDRSTAADGQEQPPTTAADRAPAPGESDVWSVVARVPDPELPTLSIAELGILREVRVAADRRVTVTITPTYAGCPAMEAIRGDIRTALHAAGYPDVEIRTVWSPPWTTDWLTDSARSKLAAAGIAPPPPVAVATTVDPGPRRGLPIVALRPDCPRCGSSTVREVSRFGATACRSLWTCQTCTEPFEHLKAH